MEGKVRHKIEYSTMQIQSVIDHLHKTGITFEVALTNYTTLIETDKDIFYFLKDCKNRKVFTVFQDLKEHVAFVLNDFPDVAAESVKYYSVNLIKRPFYYEEAYNVDIKSAYPTCLLNSKIIDEKLYDKLMELPKHHRLAAIGMLASNKQIFTMRSGEVIDHREERSPYSKFFFHCVKRIHSLIWECEVVSGLDYVFSWVDGIYVTSKDSAHSCKALLKRENYNSTLCKITDFQYTPMEDKIRIVFTKDGENKLFHIPIEDNRLAKMLKYLTNGQNIYSKNEQQ